MPRRRRRTALGRIVLGTAVLAACLLAATGCEIEVAPGSLPVPVSIAPAPSASAGQPAYVCSAVHGVLTSGALRLAEYATGDGADARAGMQRTFAEMAGQITTAGEQSTDPAQRQAVDAIAGDLTRASRSGDPEAFLNGEFTTIAQKLDGTCG
ncbi:hypothetical protein AB0F81_44905 [Actinoplanes sp. NPDC024001]|uniref:hypothetical protein n=1 Tax=Actinoplanes sp. NPDC024001 TaxID=3154598 RepID=UPI0033FBDE63